jgi:drug/metabolite transporter (DMT)-like permease
MSVAESLVFLSSSVVCSVSVGALLKAGRSRGLDVRQAIFMNYITASALCYFLLRPDLEKLTSSDQPIGIFLALGVLLPTIFIALARSVQSAGIVRTDAAQRLSLIIPLLAAFLLFGEQPTVHKLAGMALAFTALICLLWKPRAASSGSAGGWLWPMIVLFGYGVIDVLFKQMAKAGAAFSGGLLAAFVIAGCLMLLYLLVMRTRWGTGHLFTGILLGGLNFANIYTYIRAHQALPGSPALIFSVMNMGVIVLGTLVGALLFREKLSLTNLLGVGLALGAIAVMVP